MLREEKNATTVAILVKLLTFNSDQSQLLWLSIPKNMISISTFLGSLKRKRRGTFGGGGVGHAIKKPKLNKSIEAKPVKISELPVPVVVDLPSGSSVYNQASKTPSRSSMTPTTSGQASSRIQCPFY